MSYGDKYSHISELIGSTTTPFVERYRERLDCQKAATPHFEEVEALDSLLRGLDEPLAYAPVDSDVYENALQEFRRLNKTRQDIGYAALHAIERLQSDINALRDNAINLRLPDEAAQTTIDLLFSDMVGQPSQAPFANCGENDDTSWRYSSDEEVREYLSAKTFVPHMPQLEDTKGMRMQLFTTGYNMPPIQVPSSAFVHAAGFDSWLGRGMHGDREKQPGTPIVRLLDPGERFTSIQTIKNYASTPGDLPPVGIANIYIQPDDTVIADNNSGDSHRIAASLLRGYPTIAVSRIAIYMLNRNIV